MKALNRWLPLASWVLPGWFLYRYVKRNPNTSALKRYFLFEVGRGVFSGPLMSLINLVLRTYPMKLWKFRKYLARKILGVKAHASDAEITKAWKDKTLALHPDKTKGTDNKLQQTIAFQGLGHIKAFKDATRHLPPPDSSALS